MPITPIAVKNRKGTMGSQYACSDYTAINPEFGTEQEFKNFVQQAHNMGFKVIIDWVANHTGWDHVWTKSHPNYYKRDTATNDFQIASGMDDIIELDYANPLLRKAMIEAMKYWVVNCDIDGFRCDLAFWVELDFWLEARTALEKTKTLFWLAENDGIEHPEYYQAFDACYTWTWMHRTEEFYKKRWHLDSLIDVLHQYDQTGNDQSIKLWFTSNHDENSWNGTEYEKYGDAVKALTVFSFTWDGIPLIYSGQELPNKKRFNENK
jgi:glycosidase